MKAIKLYNGKIFTAENETDFAEAMVIIDNKIEYIGTTFRVGQFWSRLIKEDFEETEEINLNGKVVIPGLIDAHLHPIMLAHCLGEISCLPPEINSIEELINEIKRRRNIMDGGISTSEKISLKNQTWIIGWGCDEGKFREKRLPNRWDLDRGAKDVPVTVVRACEHIRCCNSLALKLAGIDRYTPNPPGGEIGRDENGEPNGILYENARNLVGEILPKMSIDDLSDEMIKVGKHLISQGITSICDMGDLTSKDNYSIYYKAVEQGFKQNVGVYYLWEFNWKDKNFTVKAEDKKNENQIHVAGLKLIGDGSFSGHTAWVDEAFYGTDEHGICTCSDELLDDAIRYCRENNLQLSFHAMGSRAIDRILEKLESVGQWQIHSESKIDRAIPFARIEHVTEPSEAAIQIAAKMGIAFVTQPVFLFSEIESYVKNLGEDRLKKTYPLATMLKKNVLLAISTDSPATAWSDPTDPWINIKGAIVRKAYNGVDIGKLEKISIEEAILLYTRNAAIAAGFEHRGVLKEGNYADFVILGNNPFEMEPDKIDEVKILKTFINGKEVYCG
ncbi:amidohydrolase [Eubacteriales bacterium KG127]